MTVRSLLPYERHLFADHLKRLVERDRYFRFGGYISDEAIDGYVGKIDFQKGAVKAIFSDDLRVVAAVHVMPFAADTAAEIGLSVEAGHRGNGYGTILFERAMRWAQNRSISRLCSICLRDNRPMVQIARKFSMSLTYEDDQSEGYLPVQAPNVSSWLDEVFAEQVAWIDYSSKAVFKTLLSCE